jgi:septal ring factor EnvC (AmiA/AmiB activator)
MGGIGLMNVIFSKKSLSELLSFQEYFQRMLQYDQVAISSYAAKIAELVQIRQRHEREKNRLQELVTKVKAKEEMLEATRQEKTTLLNRVKTEERLYQQAVAEIQKAAADLTASLEERHRQESTKPPVLQPNSAKKQLHEEQPRQEVPAGHTFSSLKGRLAPPVTGNLRQNKGDATSPFAGGIDIITAENQEIRAVFAGEVIASGYLRGYGYMIIIDHGQHYYSLVSRAGELLKEEGTTVQMGEVIGLTGDSGTLLGEGLHFEIRRGSMNEDPLQWLDKGQLTFGD